MSDHSRPVVLVVDDEPRVREILVRWLQPAGYATIEAPDAESAVEQAATTEPAVALCDIEMPGQGGLWLVARLRERFPRVAIVLATGVDTVPPTTSLRDGVVAYVLKPFQREEFLGAVKLALRWHRQAASRPAQAAPATDPVDAWLQHPDRDQHE